MEPVELNQVVSAVVVVAVGARCANRVKGSSLLIAFSFSVSVPSSQASFPRLRTASAHGMIIGVVSDKMSKNSHEATQAF